MFSQPTLTKVHPVTRSLTLAWHHLPSIPLVETLQDPRIVNIVLCLGGAAALVVVCGCQGYTRPRAVTAFGFYAFPFLLSSNLLVVVGTTVAERVIYLPSLGVCDRFADATYVWYLYHTTCTSTSGQLNITNDHHPPQ